MTERIAVLGAGSWGTTVAALLADRGDVILWARSPSIVQEIATQRTNAAYLGDYELPKDLSVTSSLAEAVSTATLVVLAVPSHGVRSVLSAVAPPKSASVVVSLTKGLEEGTNLRMSELIMQCWAPEHIGVLTGPNLASEVLEGQPTASVIAMTDQLVAKDLQRLFSSPTLRVYTNHDVVGCEIGGVAKNVMAIAIGMASGLGLGDNTRAALITRSLAEIARLGVALGGERLTFAGLAGLGDLVATCMSTKSRNFSFGVSLGQGRTIADITAGTRMVAEGVHSCRPVVALAESFGVEVPVAQEVVAVCYGGDSPHDSIPRLMKRAARSEF